MDEKLRFLSRKKQDSIAYFTILRIEEFNEQAVEE